MRLSERALKDQLYDIVEDEYRLPEQADAMARAMEMLPHIGSPDSELRDDLIYMILAKWVMADLFTAEQLTALLTIYTDDAHLFYKIGERGTDSVFTRSFSMLGIPPILAAHRKRPFLTPTELRQLKTRILEYLAQEQDLRGYVTEEDKGWAHAAAHTADCLDELAQCPELNAADLLDILQAIRAKIGTPLTVYVYEEGERMVYPVLACLKRKLLREAEVKAWLAGFVPLCQGTEPFPDVYRQALNVKLFLRSLYFRAKKPETVEAIGEKSAHALRNLVDEVLREIAHF
jgi:hypothetical protein